MAWIQNLRRLCIRWEELTKLFPGFLHLAGTLLLLRAVSPEGFQPPATPPRHSESVTTAAGEGGGFWGRL